MLFGALTKKRGMEFNRKRRKMFKITLVAQGN
jgi:hypothetical protein